MADILLKHPENGQHITLSAIAGTRLILDFPIEEATLGRSGNDMTFTFADGGALVLQNFYSEHTRTRLPEFEIQGQLISGEQFFSAFDKDLMPAEGPAPASQAEGGRYHEYMDANLLSGLDRLGGLDLSSARSVQPDRELSALGGTGSTASPDTVLPPLGDTVSPGDVLPPLENTSPLPPFQNETDEIPSDSPPGGNEHPEIPRETPVYADVSVSEKGLRSQTDDDTSDRTVITDKDGNPVTEAMFGGSLADINAGLTNGRLEFVDGKLTYILNAPIQHDMATPGEGEGLVKRGDVLNLTIDGKDYVINVDISDDAPSSDSDSYNKIMDDGATKAEGVLGGFTFGADKWLGHDPAHGQDWRIQDAVKVEGSTLGRFSGSTDDPQWSFSTPGGNTIAFRADGSYTVFGGLQNGILNPIQSESLTVTFTDNDGDTHTITLNIKGQEPGGGGGDVEPPVYTDIVVDERGLRSQTDDDTSDRTVITDKDGNPVTEAMFGGSLADINAGLTNGRLEFVDGKLTYILNAPIQHDMATPGEGEGLVKRGDVLNLTIDGKDYVINVDISDDAPSSDSDSYNKIMDDGATKAEGVLGGFTFGADKWLGHDPAHGQDWRIQDAVKVEGSTLGRFSGSTDDPQWSFSTPGGNTIAFRADGSYTVFGGLQNGVLKPIQGESLTVTFTDNDGDTHTITLNIAPVTTVSPDRPAGDTAQEITDSTHNVLIGEDGKHNIMVGDVTGQNPGQISVTTHNVFIAIDASGSMDDTMGNLTGDSGSRIQAVAEALHKLAQDLIDQGGSSVLNVKIVSFSSAGTTPVELKFSLSEIADMDANTLQTHLLNINRGGGTNFFPTLETVNTWFSSGTIEAAHDNKFILITDATGSDDAASDPLHKQRTVADMLQQLEGLGKNVSVEVVSMLSSFQITHAEALQTLNEHVGYTDLLLRYGSLLSAEAQQQKYDSTEGLPFWQRPLPPSENALHAAAETRDFFAKILSDNGLTQDQIDSFFADCIKVGIGPKYEVRQLMFVQMGESWKGMEDVFGDKADITFVGSADDVNTALDHNNVIGPPLIFAPGSDMLVGGNLDDILLGDTDLWSLKNMVALVTGIEAEALTNVQLYDYIRSHAELFAGPDPIFEVQDKHGLADILAGGQGNDILFGQGGDDILFGDGSEHSAQQLADYLHGAGLLGSTLDFTAGSELAASIKSLNDSLHKMDNQQLHDLAIWTETHPGFESSSDGHDTLYGGSGNDILFGQGGDDIIFGGDGDDIIFGGSGNDYIDGGAGADRIYAGSGNDIIVYDPDDTVIDGGEGIDFLVGVDRNSLDALFSQNSPMHDIEVLVLGGENKESSFHITSLTDLAKMGIQINGEHVQLNSDWMEDKQFQTGSSAPLPDEYQAFSHDDMTIILQRAILENGQG